MLYSRKKFTIADFHRTTCRSADLFESQMNRYKLALEDTDKQFRVLNQQCKECYYLSGSMAGTRSSNSTCVVCSAPIHSNSTLVDYICIICAKQNKLCVRCGGDIDMKTTRRKYPTEKKPEEPLDPIEENILSFF